MRPVRVDADGNCMFSAATVGAMINDGRLSASGMMSEDDHTNVRNNALRLREEVVHFMQDNKNAFVPFIAEDFDAYVQEMRKPDTWGGEAELSAIAEVQGCAVHVYEHTEGALRVYQSYAPRLRLDARNEICLLFDFAQRHYYALLRE